MTQEILGQGAQRLAGNHTVGPSPQLLHSPFTSDLHTDYNLQLTANSSLVSTLPQRRTNAKILDLFFVEYP